MINYCMQSSKYFNTPTVSPRSVLFALGNKLLSLLMMSGTRQYSPRMTPAVETDKGWQMPCSNISFSCQPFPNGGTVSAA